MRIATNYVRPAQRAVIPAVTLMWAAAIALAAATVWLAYDGKKLRAEVPQLRTRLAHVDAQKPVAQVHLPPMKQLIEMRERVAKINAVAQTKGVPTLALLADLEKQLPREAWLTSIHHRASEGQVQLIASARRADPLSDFLLRLEHDPLFDEVMLLREVKAGGAKADVQYEIRLKVHS